MTEGRRLLHAWFERSKRQKQEVAAVLGITKSQLSQLLGGYRRPKLELSMAIEALTGVPVTSWADIRRGKVDRTRKASAKQARVYGHETTDTPS
jgi:transcriptional regulator with XRE-family HTH domain